MQRRLPALITASLILLMVVPPILNTFDWWDKTPELPVVGHDTETTLMMAAVEVGLCVAVAWGSVCLFALLALTLRLGRVDVAPVRALRGVRATEYLLLLFSPPWRIVSLRI